MNLKTIADVDIKRKRVLVRVDFNVPIKNNEVKDDTRIVEALPTILEFLKGDNRLILMSHLGRPKGIDESLRLDPVAVRLEKLLNEKLQSVGSKLAPIKVKKLNVCTGPEAEAASQDPANRVILLENTRFWPDEKNDTEFSKGLAALGDVFVNDAFGTAHRQHSSTFGVTAFLPSYAGLLMEKEVSALDRILHDIRRPFVVILGGAKVSTKVGVIESLLKLADSILIGGAMCFTFFLARGGRVGKSLVELELLDAAKNSLDLSGKLGKRIELPADIVAADSIDEPTAIKTVPATEIPDDLIGCDIGPKTIDLYRGLINDAKTIFWNGPMGVFETEAFANGTFEIAKALAESSAFTFIGGGESVEAVHIAGVADKISHISTGGGATLEFIEKGDLPCLAPLRD